MSNLDKIQPIHIQGAMDYHVHCDYSVDAEGSIDEFCEAAIKRNLAEICFTTHYDANPNVTGGVEYIVVRGNKLPVSPDSLAYYVDDVRRAAEEFYVKGLSVKLGVEIGWFKGCEAIVQRLKERFNFDYVLCGIHEIEDICFCCSHSYEKCFARYQPEQVAEKYFEDVILAAKSGLFDSIAHLVYYLRSGQEYYGDKILRVHEPLLEDTFRALIASNTGIEINTSGIRHGFKEYYPRMDVINAAKKAGVEVNFLGSDAHKPEQVGFDFEAALALVPDSIRGCED